MTRLTKMLQWLHLNNSHSYPFCKTTPGSISESHQQSCAIESLHQFFRCSNCNHIFVGETRSQRSRNYSVSESEGAPRYTVLPGYLILNSFSGTLFHHNFIRIECARYLINTVLFATSLNGRKGYLAHSRF